MMPDRRDMALEKEEHTTDVHILAIDLAKRSFQVCAMAPGGAVLFNRMVSRAKLETILREQAPCIVAMEACATSHFGTGSLKVRATRFA
jgi:transposase